MVAMYETFSLIIIFLHTQRSMCITFWSVALYQLQVDMPPGFSGYSMYLILHIEI